MTGRARAVWLRGKVVLAGGVRAMFLAIWIGFAVVTALAAPGRGRSAWAWFGLGLLFGVFALIAVLVLPPVAPPAYRDLPPPRPPEPEAPRVMGPLLPPYHAEGDGDFDHDIVGESHYQPALEDLARLRRQADGPRRFKAVLRPEPDNPYDDNAVQVEIGQRHVGYLAREDAADWCDMLARADMTGKAVTVEAELTGGFIRDDGSKAAFGVRLDLAVPYAVKRFY